MPALALVLAAMVQIAATPAPAPVAVPARPVQWLMHYVYASDYPAEALRLNQQGTVRYELTIGPQGLATACRVIGSSGSPSLDEATCRIMRTRPRFRPARDAGGNPTQDTIRHSVVWLNPSE